MISVVKINLGNRIMANFPVLIALNDSAYTTVFVLRTCNFVGLQTIDVCKPTKLRDSFGF